jgi:Ca2+/Na+ antiporter
MTTTLPEFSISVLTALDVEGIGVAIGNALSSNVVNICLILGVDFFKSIKERETNHLDDPIKSGHFGGEAEKQNPIWKAFGVVYSREIKQLGGDP